MIVMCRACSGSGESEHLAPISVGEQQPEEWLPCPWCCGSGEIDELEQRYLEALDKANAEPTLENEQIAMGALMVMAAAKRQREHCPVCEGKGQGQVDDAELVECPSCEGQGDVEGLEAVAEHPAAMLPAYYKCTLCDGTGKVPPAVARQYEREHCPPADTPRRRGIYR